LVSRGYRLLPIPTDLLSSEKNNFLGLNEHLRSRKEGLIKQLLKIEWILN